MVSGGFRQIEFRFQTGIDNAIGNMFLDSDGTLFGDEHEDHVVIDAVCFEKTDQTAHLGIQNRLRIESLDFVHGSVFISQ